MNTAAEAARTHLRKMEMRIAEQAALIVTLQANGRDIAEPTRTLGLLRKALEDIRFQLDRVMPAAQLHASSQHSAGPTS
jgi:hypothetical protein